MTGLDGGKLVVDKRKAIAAAARDRGVHRTEAEVPSGGPDFGGHTGGPDHHDSSASSSD